MNIQVYTLFLLSFFSLYSWQLNDMHPAKLFGKQEVVTAHEVIQAAPTTALTITQQQGKVKVKGWNKNTINLKFTKTGNPEQLENTQIDIDKTKLPAELLCTIAAKNKDKQIADVVVSARIPHTNNLTVTAHKGIISTRNLERIQSLQSDNGAIHIVLDKYSIESSVFAHTRYGNIILETPKKIQAQLSATTLRGAVSSEHFITIESHTTLLNKEYWQRMKRDVHGSLGDGGAPITLETENGDIKIVHTK